jgi:hypothetical protein
MFESIATDTDPDLLDALTQTASRANENQRRNQLIDGQVNTPKPLSKKPPQNQPSTSCRMAKADRRWLRQTEQPLCESWEAWSTEKGRKDNELAFLSTQYPSRILCPDYGATSNMCPYRDMFNDIQAERRYVRLGDENQRILIHGRCTMCLMVDGRTVAYANTYYVPQMSPILLSSRVHRRAAP